MPRPSCMHFKAIFGDNAMWGNAMNGKGGSIGGWYVNYKIPFGSRIRITVTGHIRNGTLRRIRRMHTRANLFPFYNFPKYAMRMLRMLTWVLTWVLLLLFWRLCHLKRMRKSSYQRWRHHFAKNRTAPTATYRGKGLPTAGLGTGDSHWLKCPQKITLSYLLIMVVSTSTYHVLLLLTLYASLNQPKKKRCQSLTFQATRLLQSMAWCTWQVGATVGAKHCSWLRMGLENKREMREESIVMHRLLAL